MRLREQQIQETPPAASGAFDQLQIFGAKDHHSQDAQVIAQLAHRLAIETQAALLSRPIHFDFVLTLTDHPGADKVALLRVSDHLRSADASKRAHRREEINGFEDIGFSLRVVTKQQMKAGGKFCVESRVVAEIA